MEKLDKYQERISAIQASLDPDQPFVDLHQTRHGYFLTVGDDDYYTSIGLTNAHFDLLADQIADLMIPELTEEPQ